MTESIHDKLISLRCPITSEGKMWSRLREYVVNTTDHECAKRNLKILREGGEYIDEDPIVLTPPLEAALRDGQLGDRLKGMYLMALRNAGEEISKTEQEFILKKVNQIIGGPGSTPFEDYA